MVVAVALLLVALDGTYVEATFNPQGGLSRPDRYGSFNEAEYRRIAELHEPPPPVVITDTDCRVAEVPLEDELIKWDLNQSGRWQ
ncbi:hypothetical protein CAI21_08570 [Alkalilimnicola ehrlichii]|uniref:Uncharacterized protein n=1 Tax=Alkalilimnicola ehrlichii TaxID=351052 RepID=A0A3E0WUG0_9GAMM|nr:hypothetical protein [Alkalilimnicola ehrlichii]RFA29878.1 hypothetical protein CAI21_08570 [Alkalilimnicola ehrlichii]RFA36468.1 hypothetical protein CAL65_10845 [Alkalilimnicola ehrlichii]